jgi:YgiT-type zinc finger domain-containing protein
MKKRVTDLPFKISDHQIFIVKDVPVFLCGACGEINIENKVMKKLDSIFKITKDHTELQVINYAA